MDRHEYEINQLINPKKDIVKSNSKHRDKIETLIQGRRIGGIDGGGDTPEKTLWKTLIPSSESKYVYCEVEGDDKLILPIKKDYGSPVVENGVIVYFSSFPHEYIIVIINLLNEKGFNIPSSGWEEKFITENIGDPVPNWDKYKIINT